MKDTSHPHVQPPLNQLKQLAGARLRIGDLLPYKYIQCVKFDLRNCGVDWQGARASGRLDATLETATRILFAPLFLVRWLVDLPDRIVYSEPEFYGRCKFQEPYAEGTTASV